MELYASSPPPIRSRPCSCMRNSACCRKCCPKAARNEVDQLARLTRPSAMRHWRPMRRRMAALLPPIPTIAEAVAARLRCRGKAQRARLVRVARRDTEDARHPRGLAYSEGDRMRDRSPALVGSEHVALEGLGHPGLCRSRAARSSRGVSAPGRKWRVSCGPSSVAGSTNTFDPAHAWKNCFPKNWYGAKGLQVELSCNAA